MLDGVKIIKFLKGGKVSESIWEEIAGLIISAVENGDTEIEELTDAIADLEESKC